MLQKDNLLAFSAVWLLFSLVVGYAFAQFISPAHTEAPAGFLGWSSEQIYFFNWRAFLVCFSIVYIVAPLLHAIQKSWIWLGAELLLLFLANLLGYLLSSRELAQSIEDSGFLGFNGAVVHSFDPTLLLIAIFSLGGLYFIVRFIVEHQASSHLSRQPALNLGLLLIGLLSVIFFFVGVHKPVFQSTKFWFWEEQVSLVHSIEALMQANEAFVGIIVLVFTLIFPIIKFLYMFWGILANPSPLALRINKVLSFLGKFSMIDVFVLALLLLNLKFDTEVIDMELRVGVVWFALSIVLNMVVTAVVVFRKPNKAGAEANFS